MNAHTYLPEETIIRRGLEALMEALGPVETARFLSLSREHSGDYVDWHRRWQAGLAPEQFFDEVFGTSPATEKPSAAE